MTRQASLASPLARPASFPKVTKAEVERGNLIALATGAVPAKAGAVSAVARVARTGVPTAYDWRIELQAGAEPVSVSCTHAFLSMVLRACEPALVLDPSPPRETLALLVAMLVPPLLAQWPRARLELATLELAGPPAPDIDLQVDSSDGRHYVGLGGEGALTRLLAAWPRHRRALSALAISSWFRLGSTELPLEVARSLCPGDAVLVEQRSERQMPLWFAGGWKAATRTQDKNATLLTKPMPAQCARRRNGMPEQDDPGLGSLPVRLDFDVGHREIGLAELQTLQPGVVLPLNRPATEFVEISVNDRRIGYGELVDVEGAIAVRITRLFGLA